MRRGDLEDLASFACIARLRSFTRAASELGVSPSALSHAMRGLEGRLGVRLLARTTRSVAPTDAGEQLFRTLKPALDAMSDAVASLADWRDRAGGTVRLTSFGYATRTVLAPTLPGFLLRHPDISVEISSDDRPVDLVADGFHAGIRFGDAVARDMIATRIGPDLRTVVVGTPAYFNAHPAPRTPGELDAHRCINYRLVGAGGLLPWEFERDGRAIRIRGAGPLVVNDEIMAAAAVRAGAGLGYLMEHDVAADIASGRLVQVLADWCPPYPGCFLYYPSRAVTPALRALIDWLRVPG